ncbi:MAG: TonB-dependent receptor [Saprospiraceae bacterium]|nr:TonB-dependent receptor [Saprospiraceae bacterium]
MLRKGRFISVLGIILSLVCWSSAGVAQTLKGQLVDAENGDALIGATLMVKDHDSKSVTDLDGKFELQNCPAPPFQVIISYTGYEDMEYEVNSLAKDLEIRMEAGVNLQVVEVVSEYSKLKNKLSLTVESLGLRELESTSEASFYDALANMRETDMMTVSFGVKVINTRGFNSSTPIRSLQLIDGIDNASPGLNYPLGNFMGVAGLDIEGVDLVIGASSAYFGPGAFNGVVNMRTKDPFKYQGLTLELKGGQRDFFEGGLRFAHAFKNKKGRDVFGFKVNFSYSRVYDWEADDPRPSIGSLQDSVGIENPGGYDAVNRYGDESTRDNTSLFEQYEHPGLGKIFRTGYWEKDLADYNSYNLKSSAALHYRFAPGWEMIGSTNFGMGTTVMQLDNRLSLRDVWAMQNKFEIKQKDKFFLRFYTTREDAGDTYDIVSTAYILQGRRRGDGDWLSGYRDYWNRNINSQVRELPNFPTLGPPPTFTYDFEAAAEILGDNPALLQQWHDQARAAMDGNALIPGTDLFNEVFEDITSTVVSEGGTKYVDRSSLYHFHGEYRFKTRFFDEIAIGGNYRLYTPYSEGTIFADTFGTRIRTYEYGAYLGFEKWFLNDRLKANFTTRLDKHENYDYLISPAFSMQYRMNMEHSLRFSVSSALRNPTLIEQYFYFKVGSAFLLGNINGYEGLITLDSFEEYLDNGLDRNLLVYFDEPPIKPEQALSMEMAYSGIYFDNKLDVKATYYLNRYEDFIGYKIGLEVPFVIGGFPGIPIAYRFAANAEDITFTTGFSLGLNYFMNRNITLNGNYSWNQIFKRSDDPLIPAFNTPAHKFNLGVNLRDLQFLNSDKWGAGANFRWVEGYTFESSPQFTGRIPAQMHLNANISRHIPSINMTLRISGSNLLNRLQNGLYGGPLIGRFIFASARFDFK